MKKNNEYWLNRLLQEEDDIYNETTKDILDKISKLYLTTQKEILKELTGLRAYNRANNVTAISREIMLEQTLTNINKAIILLGNNINDLLTKNLTTSYIQTYETVNDTLNGLGINATNIVPANVEEIIKSPWNGTSFSDRIWHNREQLIFNAKDTISKGLIRGESYHKMAEDLAKKMSSSYNASRRLIETEVQASQIKANIDNYKENGIDKVEISAILDSKCCKDCREHDGKIIPINKVEVYTVLMHPNCRCTTLPIIDIPEE